MTIFLSYKNCLIRIKPLMLNDKTVFRIYVNTARILDVGTISMAKRIAVKFIDSIRPEMPTPPEEEMQ